MQKGNIGVTTENIFPVIKKFLYSDHDIFLREMVSNAVDATQKLKTLAATGDFKGELGDLTVRITLDEKAGTLTISDRGIGMTAEEIEKYINQIAFSGVNDFLEKYQDKAEAIIGHFGLGFYSSFMVAKKVEIITKSYREGSKAVKWSCDGSPEYTLEDADKADRGSDIVLYIDDDCKEFLQKSKIEELLNKYCKFMAVPVAFGKKTEWKDGKSVETDEDNIINNVEPLWVKAPSSLKDEDYKKFYQTLFPMNDEPLFWIHLNVDYPFNLTGILYFPRIKNNIELQRNKIQLYCNQVFVTDQVEGIVPEFLTLLHGVIDSPDIPLNVSRSYLQSDSNVKKIASYITKKVADRLQSIFKEDRKEYEKKWDDLKLFINYGMLSEADFYDRAKDFALIKDTEGKYFTLDEYKTLVKDNQTDKEGVLVNLYTTNKEEQYTYIEAAKQKGYSIIDASGQLDVPMLSMLEQKLEKTRYVRVDSDIIDRIIQKEDAPKNNLSEEETDNLSETFRSQMPKIQKAEFNIEVQALGESFQPVLITQNEYMRRMKEMSQFQQGMGFYAQMPDAYNFVLNADHPLIKRVLNEVTEVTTKELEPIASELKGQKARLATLQQSQSKKKAEELTQEEKDDVQNTQKSISELQDKKKTVIEACAKDNEVVHQLIDLALLQNGMLQGAALDKFLKRSVSLIK
ncbi:molecular chaperone HtpG [Prevotella veroralis]|uniref:Chaperone protein HtpG n=1 Tax=Prevotella veroralis F0319 TaxID=649761 RepID=C9MQI6_9BACT|nr:molecular chaperone HtpG [Prevotella veroralis]EEX18101.1 ATPase/histidine kinase/DNA gyrase B/HSP90 domain protein [Prevotella veroralis F0319]QUB41341.1 molecular chaperone HtpG [Prevotella veroralis]